MPEQRETITDKLANVIEVLQLGRKTGILSVERGEGTSFEEGTIRLISGQITDASVGQRKGREAFNLLRLWGACRFTFIPSDTSRTTAPLPPLPDNTGRSNRTETNPAIRTQSRSGTSGDMYPDRIDVSGNINTRQPGASVSSTIQGFALKAPMRSRSHEEALRLIDNYGFSRSHRQLFLLIDGTRNILELIRLTGRSQEEISRLLQDLERMGVIRL